MNRTTSKEQKALILALSSNDVKTVERMLAQNRNLFAEFDGLGNTVWHHVSSAASAQLIWEKSMSTQSLIDEKNNDGHTPLAEAIKSGKLLVASFLISKRVQFGRGENSAIFLAMRVENRQMMDLVLRSKPDMTDERGAMGNSPIHAAMYPEPLDSLLQCKEEWTLDVNIKNRAGETPLHVFINSRKIEILPLLVTLFAHGADLNAFDADGNTALHKAAANHDNPKVTGDCVKFLVAAGADPNRKNAKGVTPRHIAAGLQNLMVLEVLIAAGAKRCTTSQKRCVKDCKNEGTSESVEQEESLKKIQIGIEGDYEKTEIRSYELLNIEQVLISPRRAKQPNINLLSLDGGGMKGLVIIQTLIAIEEILEEPVFPYFDWCAGTSTGSLIIAGLAQGKTLRQMQQLLLRLKIQAYHEHIPSLNADRLDFFLIDEYGREHISQLIYPRIILTAVDSNDLPIRFERNRNYHHGSSYEYQSVVEMPLWEALRRSTAPPVLYKAVDDRYVDGAIMANNPTSDLIGEVHSYNRQLKMAKKAEKIVKMNCILSLGCGQIPRTKFAGISADTTPMFFDTAYAMEGAPVARSREWADSLEVPFFRLSAPLSEKFSASTTSNTDISKMMWDGYVYGQKHKEFIKKLIEVFTHNYNHPLRKNPFVEP